MFGFTDPHVTLDYRDTVAQWTEIERRFITAGAFAGQLLQAAGGASGFYFGITCADSPPTSRRCGSTWRTTGAGVRRQQRRRPWWERFYP